MKTLTINKIKTSSVRYTNLNDTKEFTHTCHESYFYQVEVETNNGITKKDVFGLNSVICEYQCLMQDEDKNAKYTAYNFMAEVLGDEFNTADVLVFNVNA